MSSTFTSLTDNHVYRLGNLLLEAAFCEVWTLILLTDKGEHITRRHGALIAYQLRPDGFWDMLYDCHRPKLPSVEAWSFVYGGITHLDINVLEFVAENRSTFVADLEERELNQKFSEIMVAMEW